MKWDSQEEMMKIESLLDSGRLIEKYILYSRYMGS